MENEIETSKDSVDKIFTSENKKTSRIFYLSRGLLYVFFQYPDFSWSMGQFFGSTVTHTLQKL